MTVLQWLYLQKKNLGKHGLTHWGRATHICDGKLTTIGSDNGLSPGRRQAIIWTNVGILLIGTLGTNFSEILIDFHTFSFKKMRLKVSSAKRRTFCLGLNVLIKDNISVIAWVIISNDNKQSSYIGKHSSFRPIKISS